MHYARCNVLRLYYNMSLIIQCVTPYYQQNQDRYNSWRRYNSHDYYNRLQPRSESG